MPLESDVKLEYTAHGQNVKLKLTSIQELCLKDFQMPLKLMSLLFHLNLLMPDQRMVGPHTAIIMSVTLNREPDVKKEDQITVISNYLLLSATL